MILALRTKSGCKLSTSFAFKSLIHKMGKPSFHLLTNMLLIKKMINALSLWVENRGGETNFLQYLYAHPRSINLDIYNKVVRCQHIDPSSVFLENNNTNHSI